MPAQGAHPRSRGENATCFRDRSIWCGSSPLTRGKQALGGVQDAQGGLIPAHAGKTVSVAEVIRPMGAHPRSRGENGFVPGALSVGGGSSPLTRGKLPAQTVDPLRRGLIPAHAGKTLAALLGITGRTAHPRSRGENLASARVSECDRGSSPLTRGKRRRAWLVFNRLGLIPAHAGKTATAAISSLGRGAHPRSRGENPN